MIAVTSQRTMPKHFIFILILFSLLNGFFLFQGNDDLFTGIDSDSLTHDPAYDYWEAERAYSISLSILNLVCVVVNVFLITIAIYYYIPAIDFWESWRRMRRRRKKWVR